MKISYRRNSGISYLVIESLAEDTEDPFSLKMIRANKVPHLLPLKTEKINDQTYYLFEITGKRSLEKSFETRKMSYDVFLSFMDALKTLTDELAELLLDPDRIILRTDSVFLDHSNNEFWFCIDPGHAPDPRPALKDFFNRLLSLIDYDDLQLVTHVFTLNRLTRDDSVSLHDILSENMVPDTEAIPNENPRPAILQDQNPEHASFIEKAKIYFKGKSASEIYDAVNSGRIFKLIKETNVPSAFAADYEPPRPAPVKEPEYPDIKEPLSDTAPLNISELPFHRLSGVGNSEGVIILLDHFPFTIGKEVDSADFHLERPEISRTHCRLYENEDGSFDIEDLNSTNGTLLNDSSLDPYSRIPLLPGDTVTLADMKFIFL